MNDQRWVYKPARLATSAVLALGLSLGSAGVLAAPAHAAPSGLQQASFFPAAVPVVSDLVSDGVGPAAQTATYALQGAETIALLTAQGAQTTSAVTLNAAQGTYSLNVASTTATLTFTPKLGWAGTATPVNFRVTDGTDSTTKTYTPTVTAPAAPVADDKTSSSLGVQYTDVTLSPPATGQTITLLDASSAPVTSNQLAVAGKGTFRLYPTQTATTARIVFTPAAGYTGPAAVTYKITNAYGGSDTGLYTATASTIVAQTSTGEATQPQTKTFTVPTGATVQFVDNSTFPVTKADTRVVDGVGTYEVAVSGTTATLTFTPDSLYVGTAAPVDFEVTDAGGNTSTSTYTVTVTGLAALTKSVEAGAGDASVSLTDIPASGSITLVDGAGQATNKVEVLGQGTYNLTYTTGQTTASVAFTPLAGFIGAAPAVTYKITAGDQSLSSTFTATVTAPTLADPADLTSTGEGTASQTSGGDPITVPSGGSVKLLDASGNPVADNIYLVNDKGAFVLLAATGRIMFFPKLGYSGDTAKVSFQVSNAYGQKQTGTYTPTVTKPTPPTVDNVTSTGTGVAAQGAQVSVPAGATLRLKDATGQVTSATTVDVAQVGQFRLYPATSYISFTPVVGYKGSSTSLTYVVTDAYAQTDEGTYTPTVNPPSAPTVENKTSTGAGATAQKVTVAPPAGGKLQLVDGSDAPLADNTSVVPDKGTFTANATTGEITFTPLAPYIGATASVKFQLVDAYGTESASATYTPTVTVPDAPAPGAQTSLGMIGQVQTRQLRARTGWSLTLLNPDGGAPATTVTVADEGTYVLDAATWKITFTPGAGFTGEATGVQFRVTDPYSLSGTATYTPAVYGSINDNFTTTLGTPVRLWVLANDVLAPEASWKAGSIRIRYGADGRELTTLTTSAGTWVTEPTRNTLAFRSNGRTKGTFWVRYVAKDDAGRTYTAKVYVKVS